MKLRLTVDNRAFKTVHTDDMYTTIEIDRSMFMSFPGNLDTYQPPISPWYATGEFSVIPADLKSSIEAYLNSVPSQQDIAAAMCEAKESGEVTCINPGKGMFKRTEKIEVGNILNGGPSILDLVQKSLLCFYKSPSDFLGSKGFIIQTSKEIFEVLEYQLGEGKSREVMFCKSADGTMLIRYNYTFSRAGKSVAYSDAFLEVSLNESLGAWITVEEIENE